MKSKNPEEVLCLPSCDLCPVLVPFTPFYVEEVRHYMRSESLHHQVATFELIKSFGYEGSMRIPMILGGLLVLLGEAIIFGSSLFFLWCGFFGLLNHIWFIKREEPNLERRFGDEYRQYKRNVPRWFPRRTPWILEESPNIITKESQ